MRVADARDVAIITSPPSWPNWPVLPIKRRGIAPGGWPDLGFIYNETPHELTVFEHNVFAIHDLPGDDTETKLANIAVKHVYDSLDALLDDGWYVD